MNVKRSRTFDPEFNVAIPPDGTFEHTFKSSGFYDVNCDIHPAMSAQVLRFNRFAVVRAPGE